MKKCIFTLVALFVLTAVSGATSSAGDLPESLDWRDNGGNFVTVAKDEAHCNSCWAFAATAMVESWYAISNGITDPSIDLSEQTLVSCAHDGSCSRGGNISGALNFIRDVGIPDESCFPYEGSQESCNRCDDWESRSVTIPGWNWVEEETVDIHAIKNALVDGPVTAWMHLRSDLEDYSDGVYTCEGEYVGDHFVLLVGWDDVEGVWIVKNSWGPDWGDNGFFKIAWNVCAIGEWIAHVHTPTSGCG